MYATNSTPSGAELVPLIGAAVLRAHHARRDRVNADLLRLYGLALHTGDRELGDFVLRAVFGQQLAEPQPVQPLTVTPDGTRVVRLSPETHAVIAGLAAPNSEVNSDGVTYTRKAHAEITATFPVTTFWTWASEPGTTYTEDHPRYFANTGR